jgi:hypothetical protein
MTAMRVMAERRAMVVGLMLMAEMMMASLVMARMVRMVVEMGIAGNQLGWRDGW